MRVAHADGQGGPRDFEPVGADQRIHGPRGGLARENEFPGAHVDGVARSGPDDRLGTAPGANGQRFAGGQVDEAFGDEEVHKDADAVAAHLGERAVAVAVVHEPLGVRGARSAIPGPPGGAGTVRRGSGRRRRCRGAGRRAPRRAPGSTASVPLGSAIRTKSLPVPWPLENFSPLSGCGIAGSAVSGYGLGFVHAPRLPFRPGPLRHRDPSATPEAEPASPGRGRRPWPRGQDRASPAR